MKKRIISILLPFAILIALASCTKTGDRTTYKSVNLGLTMSGSDTRTSYSGEGTVTDGLLTKERLDWTDGDLVTVYSPEAAMVDGVSHSADYKVVSHEINPTTNLRSCATVITSESSGKGLVWDTGTTYSFYGMYPSVATTGFTTTEKTWVGMNGMNMQATIPSVQGVVSYTDGWIMNWSEITVSSDDPIVRTPTAIKGTPDMKYGWMFAKKTGVTFTIQPVELVFYPKFTAFEFTIASGENESITLTSFKLETLTETSTSDVSAFIAGNFTYTGSTETVTVSSSGASNSITVNFPSGTTVTPDKSLTFTVFALPVNLTNMRITFTGDEIGTRKLTLDTATGTPLTFTPYKKYRIYGLRFPSLLTAYGEDILWDLEAHGEPLDWY